MKRLVLFFFFFVSLDGSSSDDGLLGQEEPAALAKRIYSHLFIHDPSTASELALLAIHDFPTSMEIQRLWITSLCAKGEEVAALRAWREFSGNFKEEETKHALLEELAWGVLRRAENSSQWMIQFYALMGAAFTRDARAIPLLLRGLRDSNATVRALAVRLSISMRDALLQEELLRLLDEEGEWYVRLEVIRAMGELQILSAREKLKAIAGDGRRTEEEKQAAITSLVGMLDTADEEEIRALIASPQSGLRELACEIISYFELKEEAGKILPLLNDPSSSVRIGALNCLGLLRLPGILEKIESALNDPASEVAITAAWAAALLGEEKGLQRLREWLHHAHPAFSRLAAGAVAALGKRGVPLAFEALDSDESIHDPYLQATLAFGLIGQREHVKVAEERLFSILSQESTCLWMWNESLNPLFRFLSPSTLGHTEELANYPSLIDQLIRLELLSVLHLLHFPQALEGMKEFLKHHRCEVVGAASLLLLEKGDEEALELVTELLGAVDEKVRLQAALNLALFGKESKAIFVLQEMYPRLDRMGKIQVLEALGHLGDPISIPFFVDKLEEPHQMLRVVSASALMQALYH
ncbi:MAG: hypothetical protein A2Y28_01275 [Chlamydiae bacterium GWC2_50_10]|nr:MAG: hypothetical protein A2Z85_01320 [Chlamydiae bacterium GWA2_50_15]OGN53823.1 MAG: hypothetical protein A2Y28_01275 [Chlamydiae bacterium GWC2_50_10]OGN58346.1 MAG: hypothetical protein A3D18_00305 [Chlamydiae bacterium RIFCSPHIGHO2_02_FULL_49_29]OGN64151.1 MAG: hypothetical protein A3E26_03050 [Chlamydiae bacterium RIFCSPHIGHO2_12_FULL_49_32]OGN68209.1 MAG: hypothetical protein A3I15_05000 [Chlamydiae bacterium RIFCSPLOWO2_02_FULL_49_12]OGN72896.1 MAG: hypothetical protein A3G30_01795 